MSLSNNNDDNDSTCPICCEPTLLTPDHRYPLYCTTETCHFNFCRSCIQQLATAASQGYSVASDGSSQVKIALQCPQCRAPYCTDTINNSRNSNEVVQAVLQIRHAAMIPLPSAMPDHELSSSKLSARTVFLEETSMAQLRQAQTTLKRYYSQLPENKQLRIPTKNDHEEDDLLAAWQPFVSENMSTTTPEEPPLVLTRDPTLLYGLDSLLTYDEQEYLTHLLVSNNPKFLEQAAHLLGSIMTRPLGGPMTTNNRLSPAQVEHLHTTRKRFPLPATMPRCITLPWFDPLPHTKKRPLLMLYSLDTAAAASSSTTPLTIQRAIGAAAKLGIRRGDVVTHVNGQSVDGAWDTYVILIQQAASSATLDITINANEATAQALQDRSKRMVDAGIKFV